MFKFLSKTSKTYTFETLLLLPRDTHQLSEKDSDYYQKHLIAISQDHQDSKETSQAILTTIEENITSENKKNIPLINIYCAFDDLNEPAANMNIDKFANQQQRDILLQKIIRTFPSIKYEILTHETPRTISFKEKIQEYSYSLSLPRPSKKNKEKLNKKADFINKAISQDIFTVETFLLNKTAFSEDDKKNINTILQH